MSMNVVSTEELRTVLADPQVPVEARALFALMGQQRLRVADALSADVRDVDFETGMLNVETPVRGEPRTVPLGAGTTELLRQVVGDRKDGPLLAGREGTPLSRAFASRWARAVGHSIHDFRPGPDKPAGAEE